MTTTEHVWRPRSRNVRPGSAKTQALRPGREGQEVTSRPDQYFSVENGKPRLDSEQFGRRFLDIARKRFDQAGVEVDIPTSSDLAGQPKELKTAITVAVRAALQLPGQAPLAWAIEAHSQLMTRADQDRADRYMIERLKATPGIQNEAGLKVHEMNGLHVGAAGLNCIFLASALQETPAFESYVTGHEESHVKNGDGLKGNGSRMLVLAVEDPHLKAVLRADWKANSREQEYRSDRDGFDRAVADGQEPAEVLAAVKDGFARFRRTRRRPPRPEHESHHPTDENRVKALIAHARESGHALGPFAAIEPPDSASTH